jgi:cyanate permease
MVMKPHRRSAMRRLTMVPLQEWDATLSVIAAAVFWVVVGTSSRPLEPSQSLFITAVTIGVTIGSGAFVAGRWVSDRLSKDEYGTLIVAFDPDESQTQRPYFIMALAGFITALLGILLAVTVDEFPRFLATIFYGLEFALVIYCVLGSISLVIISRRHQRRAAILRAMKEEAAREQRRRQGEAD